jgi:integrase
MAISAPRLYRKPGSGVYFARVLIGPVATGKSAGKTELRRSLRTKCPILAGRIIGTINAVLAQVPMSHRATFYDDVHRQILDRFLGHESEPLRIEDPADLTNFIGFFEDLNQQGLEEFKGVFIERVAKRGVYSAAPPFTVRGEADREAAIQLMKELARPELSDLKDALLTRLRGRPVVPRIPDEGQVVAPPEIADQILVPAYKPAMLTVPERIASASVHGVDNPLPWNLAVERYSLSLRADDAVNSKTISERKTLLGQLHDFLVAEYGLAPNFFVHEVKKHHIAAFMDRSAGRPARSARKKLTQDNGTPSPTPTIAPGTLLKRISSLELFFRWALEEIQATDVSPADGLERRKGVLRERKNGSQESYKPFTAAQLKSVFEPRRYLMECRDADHFWAPLLGAHLGVRLGEIVTLQLDAIQQHALSGIWYADILPELAKNANSVRRLPITQPLIDLGFIDYVHKLKTLGATSLFPHRDMSTTSAIRQPSKNTSEKFARFLDVCGVTDKDLVFHSFRHTVVTALQYGGVPLHVSQQIVGHMAQDHAIKTGELTQEQARSVTFSSYTHTDIPSLTVEDPFKVLKDALEKAVRPPLDYPLLKRAAAIVLQHVRKTPEGFESGWAPQDKKYSQQMATALTGDDQSSI